MQWKSSAAALCCAVIAAAPLAAEAQASANHLGAHEVKHVLLVSVDGLHSIDLTNWINNHPDSALAELSGHGTRYLNASTTTPSDSFPGLAALLTGGSPTTSGLWYDVTYNRALAPPAKTTPYGITGSADACRNGVVGTPVGFDEEIDRDYTRLNGGGGLNPDYLPRDPAHNCAPVYPHNYMRVNTVFEVAKQAGYTTAWIDKHPAYEWTNGPSGSGVEDFWGPEINSIPTGLPGVEGCESLPDPANATSGSAWTDSLLNVQCYDKLKVNGVLNQIDGYTHDRARLSPVPGIFGMNFQAVSVGQKSKTGGYRNYDAIPTPNLAAQLQFVDGQIGRMVAELKSRGLYDSTLLIIAAKHGQSAIDPHKIVRIPASAIPAAVGSSYAFDLSDDGSLIWLKQPSQVGDVVAHLDTPEAMSALGIQEIFAGALLAEKWDSPFVDPRTPDIILKTNTGVVFTDGSKIAEHGGLNEDDTHVALLVSFHSFKAGAVKTEVLNQQVAPSILQALGLNPRSLQAVQREGVSVLPFLF